MDDSVDPMVADITERYPAVDADVEGVIDRMSAINRHVSRAFEETLSRHGLAVGDYKLLLRLSTWSGEIAMSAGLLSRMLMVSSGGMTNRLDRLEADGWVRRVRDPRDRRGVLVELTGSGRRQIEGAVVEQAAKEADVLAGLSGRDLQSLNRLLRKVLLTLETTD